MRKLSVLFLAGTLLLVPFCGCAQSSSQAQTDGQAQADGKYDEIIADLEEEDYDGAIDAITEMKKEAQAKAHADMKDYLVTVELTKDNFGEYFEWVTVPVVDTFGDQEEIWCGLRSKKYDDGLILYGLDDATYSDSIYVKYSISYSSFDNYDNSEQKKDNLKDMLYLNHGLSVNSVSLDSIDSVAGSKLTFVKKEFVESYDIKPAEHPDDPYAALNTVATITLKNGETFERSIARDYPY